MLTTQEQLWEQASSLLKEIITPADYEAWFRSIRVLDMVAEPATVRLGVDSDFFAKVMQRRFMPQLHAVFEEICGFEVDIEFATLVDQPSGPMKNQKPAGSSVFRTELSETVPLRGAFNELDEHEASTETARQDVLGGNRNTPKPDPQVIQAYQSAYETTPTGYLENPPKNNLNPRYIFRDFVVGESNRYAHAAAQSVADPESTAFNPLFIYGRSGLGKTHLMHAIGHKFMRQKPGARVLYVTLEQFINSFIESINSKQSSNFRNLYRKVDLLLLDDVQFLIGRERTQEEMFHTFNDLFEAGNKIVLTSDRQPRELTTLTERLRSRFEWGVIADIQPPDLETRIAILRQKASQEKLTVSDEILIYIAESFTNNIRELEGALKQILVQAEFHGRVISFMEAQDVLRPLINTPHPARVSVDQIQTSVCQYYGITLQQLSGGDRSKKFSFPRHVALYLARELTELSFPDIAQKFGGKDHTSVIYAYRKIKMKMDEDPIAKAAIESLAEQIASKQRQGT
ncbi:MAG: chromosomal replication initiator protein DnaA [Candidatus Sumerlaeia bacterium]|nr:chromosomal replication initiator protein DnaA [Candidatus Sumerlaeia bacterium]